ncbi:hypothetical protein [Streptomyces sp. PR69]|uniref:hypothetical protein n=1 Tax=Streptomyces sp. PR69 TaxID=2984950 RepID=UPI002263C393|nr:hypothetical protein [Streptomyces sp. PR69]
MLDVTELEQVVDHLAERLRAAPQSRLQRGAAAEGLALARDLSVRAQRLEAPGREPRIMPDAGVFAVADQLTVAGRDLAEALRGGGDGEALAEAVARVREAAVRAGL